jgi:hypothetical protein
MLLALASLPAVTDADDIFVIIKIGARGRSDLLSDVPIREEFPVEQVRCFQLGNHREHAHAGIVAIVSVLVMKLDGD